MISWFLLTRLLILCLYWRRSTFARWDSITKTTGSSSFCLISILLTESMVVLQPKDFTFKRNNPRNVKWSRYKRTWPFFPCGASHGCDSVTHIFWLLYCQLSPQPLTLLLHLLAASFKYSSESDLKLLTSDLWDTLLLWVQTDLRTPSFIGQVNWHRHCSSNLSRR